MNNIQISNFILIVFSVYFIYSLIPYKEYKNYIILFLSIFIFTCYLFIPSLEYLLIILGSSGGVVAVFEISKFVKPIDVSKTAKPTKEGVVDNKKTDELDIIIRDELDIIINEIKNENNTFREECLGRLDNLEEKSNDFLEILQGFNLALSEFEDEVDERLAIIDSTSEHISDEKKVKETKPLDLALEYFTKK